MKKRAFSILEALVVVAVVAIILALVMPMCMTEKKPSGEPKIQQEYLGYGFYKIVVEGHEYITCSQRSITHLESCPCKKQ